MTDYTPIMIKAGRVRFKTWTYHRGRAREVFISCPKWKVHLSGLMVVNRVKKLPPRP